MTTKRMTQDDADRTMSIGRANAWGRELRLAALDDWARARRVEHEQAEKIRALEDMLRLASDKMAEQVRQARWEVAVEIISSYAATYRDHFNLIMEIAHKVRDANAPKD